MKSLNQRGAMNMLLIPLIMLGVFFVGAAGFAAWAFMSREDYKSNSDQKTNTAVQAAIATQKDQDEKTAAEKEKLPYDKFIGASQFGTITMSYPKTWSAYIEQADSGATPIRGWLHPGIVPNVADTKNAFALRFEVNQTKYEAVATQFSSLVKSNQVTMKPFTLPKVPSVVGYRIEGQITPTKQGTMIVLPIRDRTLKIWTEAPEFKGDLENHILPNLSFDP